MPSTHHFAIIVPFYNYNGSCLLKIEEMIGDLKGQVTVDISNVGLNNPLVDIKVLRGACNTDVIRIINAHIGARYIGREDQGVGDDDEIFDFLQRIFDLSENYGYQWLHFKCVMLVEDEHWDKEYEEGHELEDMFLINKCTWSHGLVDGWDYDMSGTIHFDAKTYFTEQFYNVVCGILLSIQLANTHVIEPGLAIISNVDKTDNSYYGHPDTRAYKFSGADFVRHSSDDDWKIISALDVDEQNFLKTWQWLSSVSGFLDGKMSIDNFGRALNSFAHNLTTINLPQRLIYNMIALESLYCKKQSKFSIGEQLRIGIEELLDAHGYTLDCEVKELKARLYNQRSKIVHGAQNMPSPFRSELFPAEEISHFNSSLAGVNEIAYRLVILSLRSVMNSNSQR